jgi:hypothetical protein
MIERERSGKASQREHLARARVVAGPGLPGGPGQEDHGDIVLPRVPAGIRVRVELPQPRQLQSRLLQGFPSRGILQRLPVIHEPAGKRPAQGRVAPLDEKDPLPSGRLAAPDDDIHGQVRIPSDLRTSHWTWSPRVSAHRVSPCSSDPATRSPPPENQKSFASRGSQERFTPWTVTLGDVAVSDHSWKSRSTSRRIPTNGPCL